MRASRRLIAASYDRAATGYAAADQHVYARLAVPLVDAVNGARDIDDRLVLDVAAGTGAVGRNFAHPVAIDVSHEQLMRNPARGRVLADGELLPFADGAFAAAVCGFGINHVGNPVALVREMARVAQVVGVSTWLRPETPYRPKQLVQSVLARRAGAPRSAAGYLIDRCSVAVGSVDAVSDIFASSDLAVEVAVTEVTVPWPGVDAYLDYRLSMPTSNGASDDPTLRAELRSALGALPEAALEWRPRIVVAVSRSSSTPVRDRGRPSATRPGP